MTEEKKLSATNKSLSQKAASITIEKQQTSCKVQNSATMLAILGIVVSLLLSSGLYYNTRHKSQSQTEITEQLTHQLQQLQQQLNNNTQQLTEQLTTKNRELQSTRDQQHNIQQQLEQLQEKFAAISGNNSQVWLLAQADYLVKLAGRKLWSDKDVTTAAALLKSADLSLAEMNDPCLIELRRTLTRDISTLSAISQVDFDGIILKLNQLTNDVDNLRIADSDDDSSPMDSNSNELSSSLGEWRQNLLKSWHTFMENFITIRHRNNSVEPLLAPHQDIYLRENIRSRLLVAAQAVPRHQEEIYKQSIDTVATWMRTWFNPDDLTTKAFINQLNELSQQSILIDIPDIFESQPMLDKLIQTRVRNLLAQPSTVHQKQEK